MPKRFVVPASDFSEFPRLSGDVELSEALTAAAQRLHGTDSPQDTLSAAVRITVRLLPGAEQAAISVIERDGPRRTVAWTDESVGVAEASGGQASGGHASGAERAPYWDALWHTPVVRLADSEAEDGGDGSLAAAGLRSALALRLRAEKKRLTVLTAYAGEPRAFDDRAVRVGRLFTAHVSLALESTTKREQLNEAMRTRDMIGQATGVLMERLDIDAAEAFDSLVRASQRENVKLRDLARRIVDRTHPA
ncbi:GAF and ANTAR domain-containing protein [Streptomyces sp. NPDC046985]|uniref:GAF and ANTAR domain-containing protein n=1 Tax=Streptomyces sp. NPDC046985 TaxID=3155377 RepID=UPI00340A3623